MPDTDTPRRPRCCAQPKPEATWGLGTADHAYITVWCANCGTDLIILDPPGDSFPTPEAGE